MIIESKTITFQGPRWWYVETTARHYLTWNELADLDAPPPLGRGWRIRRYAHPDRRGITADDY